MLRERGIPFFFLTGYGIEGVDLAYRDEIVLQKPVDPAQLVNTIGKVLAR